MCVPSRGVAQTTLGKTNGFVLMENTSQLVSYAGSDVMEDQSGKRAGKTKISKKGNSRIHRALYFPAITTVDCGVTPLYNLFRRTYQKHYIR